MGNHLPSREAFVKLDSEELATLVKRFGLEYEGVTTKILGFGITGTDVVEWDRDTFEDLYNALDEGEETAKKMRKMLLCRRLELIKNASTEAASSEKASPVTAAAASSGDGRGSSSSGMGGSAVAAASQVSPDPRMCGTNREVANQIIRERKLIEAEVRKNNAKAKASAKGSSSESNAAAGASAGQPRLKSNKKRSLSGNAATVAATGRKKMKKQDEEEEVEEAVEKENAKPIGREREGPSNAEPPANNAWPFFAADSGSSFIYLGDMSHANILPTNEKRQHRRPVPFEQRKKEETFESYYQRILNPPPVGARTSNV